MTLRLQFLGILLGAYALLTGLCSARAALSSVNAGQNDEPQLRPRGVNWSSGKSHREVSAPETDLYPPHLDTYQQQYYPSETVEHVSKSEARAQKMAEKKARIDAEVQRKLQEQMRNGGGAGTSGAGPLSDHQRKFQRYKANRRLRNQDTRDKYQQGQ